MIRRDAPHVEERIPSVRTDPVSKLLSDAAEGVFPSPDGAVTVGSGHPRGRPTR